MRWAPRGHPVPDISRWDRFAADVRDLRDQRVCLSTEDFGRIRKLERSQKIVEDLGADRLHVVAVARPYHRLLPSHWQERVKSHEVRNYDTWLRTVLGDDEGDEAHRSFWTSHDIGWMTSRWLPFLPADRFTVIVADDADRGLLMHTFERLLGLPEDFLSDSVAEQTPQANASLSANSTELLRLLNALFEERGWSDRDYTRYVQRGLVPALQAAGRSSLESSVPPLPAWAAERVRHRSVARIAAIRTAGVNVVGDLDRLLPPEVQHGSDELRGPDTVSIDSAATAAIGVVEAALRREVEQAEPRRVARGPRVEDTSARSLVREIARRQRRRLRRG